MRDDEPKPHSKELPGIKHGISGGQWESYFDPQEREDDNDGQERYQQVGCSSSIGRDEFEFLAISYDKDGSIRFMPTICVRDLDRAMFLPFVNASLAEKIQAIHVFANGYKIHELGPDDLQVDAMPCNPRVPVEFTEEELKDPWVRVRPSGMVSTFRF